MHKHSPRGLSLPFRRGLLPTLLPSVAQALQNPLLRLAWCVLGAATGLALALWLAGPRVHPFLLASLGGSAVFLFGLTRAPAAQPRALFGGHLGGAAAGIACGLWLGDTLLAYSLAVGLTLAWMLLTRTVHPPAGATPLVMVHAQVGWGAMWSPVLLGVLALVAVVMVWSRLYPRLVHYPVQAMAPSPNTLNWGGWSE
jgi:CBS-domain-containing membrane protein